MSATEQSNTEAPSTTSLSPNQKYFAKLLMNQFKEEYSQRVAEMAQQNPESFEISVRSMRAEASDWEKKTFYRQRITASQYMQIERLRGEYHKEMDPAKAADALANLYKYLANVFLNMPETDFESTDWQEIKPILDSINFRLVSAFPNVVSTRAMQQQQQQVLKRTAGRRP